jgi:hypothetical protein
VDVFVADRFRLGAHLANSPCVAFGRPTCGRALRCVGAPILRMCLALHLVAQPWGGRIKKSTSKPKFFLIHPPTCLLAYCSLVWTFSLWMSFAFGRPSCRRGLRCVAAPNLRTWGRALHCECALCLRCGCALARPTCGRALCCVGAPNLRTCLVLRLGTHLADVPCVALGCPTLVRPY